LKQKKKERKIITIMMFKSVLLVQLLVSVVVAAPVDKVPTSKHVQWVEDADVDADVSGELLSPIDNLVEPEDYVSNDEQQEVSEVNPKSENFVTGHRIPLELFSPDTLKRIELIPEAEPARADDRYVNSESFRSGPTTTSTSTEAESEVELRPRPHILEDDRETLLGAKIDPNYRRTLIKFLPDY